MDEVKNLYNCEIEATFIGTADFPSYIDAAEEAIEITIQDLFEESGT